MKVISEKFKARAIEWATNPPRAMTCSVCGATGPTLAIGDTDTMHSCFTARCEKHLDAAPAIRNVYSIILEGQQDPAQTDDAQWFAANPNRTHRLRPTHAGEIEKFPHVGPLVLVRQHVPNIRTRVCLRGPWLPDLTANDAALRRLYDEIRSSVGGSV